MIEAISGDCIKVVPTLGKFDLVFADPPFNIGRKYDGFVDKNDNFEQWCLDWIACCWDACQGVMVLHGPDSLAEIYLIAKREYNLPQISWINWHYNFGQCRDTNWIDARCHALIFARDNYTWNPDAVRVQSARVRYGDKRVNDTEKGGRRVPGTVWGIPSDGQFWGRVQGNSAERRPCHDNQLPEKYLERIILAYTNTGDRVLDPFAGSGTTAVVCSALGRNCVTIDVSDNCVNSVRERILKGAVRIHGTSNETNNAIDVQ